MRKMGVPYPNGYEATANDDLQKQAATIADNLKQDKIEIPSSREIIALIAYLQRLGKDVKVNSVTNK